MNFQLVLGIETSCDETAASVIRDGKTILSDVVISQVDIHKEFGGVVPELASRKHIESISFVISKALSSAAVKVDDLDGIGVTRGPGLIGSLLVGIGAAKGMALVTGLPIVGVNHLHAHLSAVLLERNDITHPFTAMVVSGGHTSIFHVKGPLDISLIGKTRDDAAGEAFDKVAKLMGLGYPGGVVIQQRAEGVDPNGLRFPRALMENDSLDFSFSGLKTAVLRKVEEFFGVKQLGGIPGSFHPLVEHDDESQAKKIGIISAAFQDAVTDVLVLKGIRAAELYKSDKLIICGGVAANKNLREKMLAQASSRGIEAVFPSISLCTDNAAMVAARAHVLLSSGIRDDLTFGAISRW